MMNPADLARQTLNRHFGLVDGGFSALDNPLLARPGACFVTLHTDRGALRGCIGTLEPQTETLADEIRVNAVSAATRDPRFAPLKADELANVHLSVDLLSEPEKTTVEGLNPKTHGIIVASGLMRGVLLPDLKGVETAEKQLNIACRKAGIDPEGPFELWRFTVQRYVES